MPSCRDETTVLALNGLGKVLKANMGTVVAMQGFDDKWDEMCSISAKMLSSGRKSVAIAAAQLLTGFLQVYVPSSFLLHMVYHILLICIRHSFIYAKAATSILVACFDAR